MKRQQKLTKNLQQEKQEEFRDIRGLEKVLIARRLLFKKISIMPKGQSPKFAGALCSQDSLLPNVYMKKYQSWLRKMIQAKELKV